jgi:hypothetical protein
MTWRKVWATEYDVHQSDIDGSALPLASMGVLGKRIRVTVEEEVSECCEKWRGGVTLGKMAAAWDWKTEAKFCPECGRKL